MTAVSSRRLVLLAALAAALAAAAPAVPCQALPAAQLHATAADPAPEAQPGEERGASGMIPQLASLAALGAPENAAPRRRAEGPADRDPLAAGPPPALGPLPPDSLDSTAPRSGARALARWCLSHSTSTAAP